MRLLCFERATALAAALAAAPFAAATQPLATFDYVIAGAGPCGLVLANRLSADPAVTVAVVEPGGDVRGNPNVTNIVRWLDNEGTAVDWQYESAPQAHAGHRSLVYHSGKAIGGSTAINGMTYIRGDAVEIDAWETLGNQGWNWDALFPYYKKAERFSPPTQAQATRGGASYDAAWHGERGPLAVGFLPELATDSFYPLAADTWASLGYPAVRDPNGGSVRGFDVWPMTVDADADVREDAARAYFWPVADGAGRRPNLVMIRGTVTHLLWDDHDRNQTATGGAGIAASGVAYLDADGAAHALGVRKEAILAAGSLRSPPILERSGVGNAGLLGRLGIETKVDLPGVGENLQDQPNVVLAYEGSINETGYAPYATFATVQDLLGVAHATELATRTRTELDGWARTVAASRGGLVDADHLARIFAVQHDLIFERHATVAELLTTASGATLVSAFWALLPFSRGGVHLRSTAPADADKPIIDPGFFSAEWDLDLQVAIGRLAARFWETAPAAGIVVENLVPGKGGLAPNASEGDWQAFIKNSFTPNDHPIGTAAMLPRGLGGVVDAELRVYGTANVRVVDASVLPLQVSGHLSSTLYALAERAAELIRGA